jgi:hypothetical protein
LQKNKNSGGHRKPSTSKDFTVILNELLLHNVFDKKTHRKHSSVPIKHFTLEQFDRDKISDYLIEKIIPKFFM